MDKNVNDWGKKISVMKKNLFYNNCEKSIVFPEI